MFILYVDFFKQQKNNVNDNYVWLLIRCVFNFEFENNYIESNSFQLEFILKCLWRLIYNLFSIIKFLLCCQFFNSFYYNFKINVEFVYL